jgi:hypothetical protein
MQKWEIGDKILNCQPILTIDIAFYSGERPLSEPQSADRLKSILGDTKRQKVQKGNSVI